MLNRRGQIFSGILVLITLFMCGVSIWVYMIQQEDVQSYLVSPLAVLELRDAKDIFEMREKELILESLENVDFDFGSDEFLEEFREKLISRVGGEGVMSDFIFSDFALDGVSIDGGFDRDAFIRNVVYNRDNFEWKDSSSFEFSRGKIEKRFEMRALDDSKNNFVVDADFVFDGKYLVEKRGSKFFVEEIE